MALKQSKKSKNKQTLKNRFEQMSKDELSQRWRDMRPRYYKWLALFISLAALIWLTNHALILTHTMEDLKANYETIVHILNAAFQIALIFTVLFVGLTGMSYYLGRPAAKVTA